MTARIPPDSDFEDQSLELHDAARLHYLSEPLRDASRGRGVLHEEKSGYLCILVKSRG